MSYISTIYRRKQGIANTMLLDDIVHRLPLFVLSSMPEPEPVALIGESRYATFVGYTEASKTPYYWDPSKLMNQLVAIVGTPGGGKSHLVKNFVIRFKRANYDVPVFIVDPEDEYKVLIGELGYGEKLDIGIKHYINIFDRPTPRTDYQTWAKKVIIPGILKALKMPSRAARIAAVLDELIMKLYDSLGFKPNDPTTWDPNREPTMLDLYNLIDTELEITKQLAQQQPRAFSGKIEALQTLKLRIGAWVQGRGSDFFAYKSTIPLSDLMKSPLTILNIKHLPGEARDLLTYMIFMYFYKMFEEQEALVVPGIRLFVVFDEAWILMKAEPGSQETPISELVRRMRKYGMGLLLATQFVKDIEGSVLPAVGTVFIFNIRDDAAVNKLARSLNLPKRIYTRIPYLPRGFAVVSPNWADKSSNIFINTPFVVRVVSEIRRMVPLLVHEPEIELGAVRMDEKRP
jgi:hypothetical protein